MSLIFGIASGRNQVVIRSYVLGGSESAVTRCTKPFSYRSWRAPRPSLALGRSLSEALVRGTRASKPAESPIFQAASRLHPARSPGPFDGLILFRVFSNPGKRLEFLRIQLQPCFIHKRLRLLNLCLCIACPLHTRMVQLGLPLVTMVILISRSTRILPRVRAIMPTTFQLWRRSGLVLVVGPPAAAGKRAPRTDEPGGSKPIWCICGTARRCADAC